MIFEVAAGAAHVPVAAPVQITLGHLDSAVLVASIVVAVALRVGRHLSGQELTNEQLFYDMLSFWTCVELTLLFLADIDFGIGLPVPDFAELIRSNGVLLPIALAYCAFLVAQSTLWPTISSWRAKERPKGQPDKKKNTGQGTSQ